ncbi:hypothetical protein D3C80_904120 [compost metagenome]
MLQCLVGAGRHVDGAGKAWLDLGIATAQDKGRFEGADDLRNARSRVSGVGHGEGQAGAQGAEHGINQRGTTAGDDYQPIAAIGAVFQQVRGNALADAV